MIDDIIWFVYDKDIQGFDHHESSVTVDADRTSPTDRVAVAWAPAFELIVSLIPYAGAKKPKMLDLGANWQSDVRQRLAPDFDDRLQQASGGSFTHRDADLLLSLAVQLGDGPRDADAFLDRLAALSVGELYERLAPTVPDDGAPLPRDLGAVRDHYCHLLRDWNDGYFKHLDPAILDGLERAATARRATIGSRPALDAIEDATNGVRFESPLADSTFVLIPQYHHRPFNHLAKEHARVLVLYPADVEPTSADDLPHGLLRLTRCLADESRLRVLRYLGQSDAPRTLTEVARAARLTQSTVHHHLGLLRAAGLVRVHIGTLTSARYTLRPRAMNLLGEHLAALLAPA